ncbi:GSCOCG00007319001-RA-CDS [Cotesia congregata]|nr:GSCOCG00007319001-RA-CDS [Cotesia congregata]
MTPVVSFYAGDNMGPEKGGFRHNEFRFSINPDYFGFYYLSKVYMTIEFDSVFGNYTGHEDEFTKTRRVNFKGSSIACWMRDESDVVLIGFSTMVYKIPHKWDAARNEVELIEGTVFDFTHDLDDFNKPGYLDIII